MGVVEFLRFAFTAREWNIGLTALDCGSLVGRDRGSTVRVVPQDVQWLKKPWFVRDQADPFLLEHGGRVFLYYEELVGGSRKSRLRMTELSRNGTEIGPRKTIMRFACHASYPYVFEHSGAFYCLPETARRRNVTLYRSETPLGPWTKQGTLLPDLPGIDSTVFPFGDRWWLFCTLRGAKARSTPPDLHVWHAPAPDGPWEPHALQPAKTDAHSARPAGRPFVVDGVLYRPAQDCLPRYGARVAVNRVLTLTPHDFSEEVCCYLEPNPLGPYPDGLHTVTWAGALAAIDGRRTYQTFNPYKLLREVVALSPAKLKSIREYGQRSPS